jgi:molybdenum cofactor biosynthesis enzyme MoaA
MSEQNEITTLLDELSSFEYTAPTTTKTRKHHTLTEDNITDFVIKSSEELINAGLESVTDLREYVVQGQNPDEIEALAGLISSTTNAIESLNKMVLLKKKNEAAKELKIMELENRKEVAALLPQNNIITNTNVVVASRDEIIKKLISGENKTLELEDNTVIQGEIE